MIAQDQAPTVGDTLTVVHRVRVPPGALIQPRAPTDSTLATLVGIPDVQREGDSVRIAYTIAVWAPGRHELTIPGAVVVEGSGRIDTLPDATVALRVASVLPERMAVESVAPQAARPWVERTSASPIPFIVVFVLLALLLAGTGYWWRRRGPVVPAPVMAGVDAASHAGRMAQWIEAGEVTMAIDHIATLLPDDAASRAWRDEVARRRFDPDAASELEALAREGLDLLGREAGA